MGTFSLWHWLIVAIAALLLFGRGRISETMGDFGKGIRSFKEGMGSEEAGKAAPAPPERLAPPASADTATSAQSSTPGRQ